MVCLIPHIDISEVPSGALCISLTWTQSQLFSWPCPVGSACGAIHLHRHHFTPLKCLLNKIKPEEKSVPFRTKVLINATPLPRLRAHGLHIACGGNFNVCRSRYPNVPCSLNPWAHHPGGRFPNSCREPSSSPALLLQLSQDFSQGKPRPQEGFGEQPPPGALAAGPCLPPGGMLQPPGVLALAARNLHLRHSCRPLPPKK